LAVLVQTETTPASGGSWGQMARRQYAALIVMRWRMVANHVRSVQGAFELGARGVAFLIYSIMGLSVGVGLGAGAYSFVSNGHPQLVSALFWTVFLVWQAVPIVLASFQEQFDLAGLLRFPVNFGSFYVLNLVFGLVDVPTILGSICCLGILTGVTVARPGLFGWTALVLAAFAVFNILLARTVLAWVDRWLAKRRTREVVSAIFLLLMLSLQLLNPALRQETRHHTEKHAEKPSVTQPVGFNGFSGAPRWLKTAMEIVPWLPPGAAGSGFYLSAEGNVRGAFESLGVLALYMLGTGALLGVRLHAEYRGEHLSDAPPAQKRTAKDSEWLIDGSGPIAAVLEKELRTVPRSMPLLFAIGAPLLTVLVISTVFRNGALGGRPFQLAFPLCVCYALLGFTQMIFNNLGAEGTGVQMLFLSPTPIRTVLLAKNLFHGMLFIGVAFLAGVLAALRLGRPEWTLLATTAAWVLFALPTNLAAGNVLSLTMPYRVNLGRISRQRGSQASALVSMLIQAMVMGAGVAVLTICSFFEKRWLAAPCLLVMAGIALAAWMRVLSRADSIANRNRENLIATLAKTE
jgi:ABC-2 type transport system permease protein